jgi:hypothetical protein
MKVKVELDDHDSAETIDLIQRLVTALERLVERLEEVPDSAGKEDV